MRLRWARFTPAPLSRATSVFSVVGEKVLRLEERLGYVHKASSDALHNCDVVPLGRRHLSLPGAQGGRVPLGIALCSQTILQAEVCAAGTFPCRPHIPQTSRLHLVPLPHQAPVGEIFSTRVWSIRGGVRARGNSRGQPLLLPSERLQRLLRPREHR